MSTLNRKQTERREAGFTLVEMLIAMAIFVIASTVAFLLYDNAQRSFKRGVELTEQQQVTRVAFDKLLADLRMAGFNYNPTGHPDRTDEQIEGAWAMAVTIRGDFDFEDPTKNTVPESTLDDGVFDAVSTGNDEIVTYMLAKDAGNIGGDTLTYFADTSDPRDTATEQVDVNNTALTAQNDPPYTLYRVILDTTGTPVKEPLADNIYSMAFTYYDGSGTAIDPATMTGVDTAAAQAARANVRRITVDVVGLTPNNDLRYVDAADTDPDTQKRRKFQLQSDVQPRNLGMKGAADLDHSPPSIPTGFSACDGHCGGLVLDWTENATTEGVIAYDVKYGTSAGTMNTILSFATPASYLNGLSDASNYYLAIRAKDAADNKSSWSATIGPQALSSDTVPDQVLNPTASAGSALIDLTWDEVTTNTSAGASEATTGCDPDRPVRRDSAGYNIYRQKTPTGTFNLVDADDIFTSATSSYADTSTSTCVTYGYRVTGIDGVCSSPLEGAPSVMVTAASTAVAQPAAPQNTDAQLDGTGNDADLIWDPVTEDIDSPPNGISVDAYEAYTAVIDTSLGEDPVTATYAAVSGGWNCSTPTTCRHTTGGAGISLPLERWYKVRATTNCASPNDVGVSSDPFKLGCFFGGTTTFLNPTQGDDVTAGTVALAVDVSGTGTYTQATFVITDLTTTTVVATIGPVSYSATSPNFSATWNASGLSGPHRVQVAILESGGCVKTISVDINVVTPVACCLAITSANVITQGGTKKELRLTYDNLCGVPLTVDQVSLEMSDILGTGAKWTLAEIDGNGPFFTNAPGAVIIGAPHAAPVSPAEVLSPGTHALTNEFSANISDCAGTTNTFDFQIRYTRPETGPTQFTCPFVVTSATVSCI